MPEGLFISKDEFESRLQRAQELMRQKDFDGLLVFSGFQEREGHVSYLTNHHNTFPNVLSHMGLGHSALVLPAKGLGTLISPFGYETNKVVNIDVAKTGFVLVADILAALKERGLDTGRLGIAGLDVIPAEYYEMIKKGMGKATFEVANEIIESMRLLKSPGEIELLRKAARVADAGLLAGMEASREGATGHDVELAVRSAGFGAGADFIPRVRVSTGPKLQALNWPMSTGKKIAKGDFVYLDVIGWANGYGFDNSRIKVVGKPTDEQKDYLDHVVEATEWMIGILKPGARLGLVMTMSRERQIVAFGHGIGLEICENPWLTLGPSKALIEPNMVLCIEPNVIDRQFGGMCIEDMVVITDTGVEVLNQCPRVLS
jgi:Xaa-Pro aminopeptidase